MTSNFDLVEFVKQKYSPKTTHMYLYKTSWSVCEECGSVLDAEENACMNNADCPNYYFKEEYNFECRKRGLKENVY